LLGGYTSSAHHGGGTTTVTGGANSNFLFAIDHGLPSGGFTSSRTLARDEIHYYEFAVLSACSNLLLTAMTLSGDQNIYANTFSYPSVQAGAIRLGGNLFID
jgi:hypothetical protein